MFDETEKIDLKTLCSLRPLWLDPVTFTAFMGSIQPPQEVPLLREYRVLT
jgi:hypothetical protein